MRGVWWMLSVDVYTSPSQVDQLTCEYSLFLSLCDSKLKSLETFEDETCSNIFHHFLTFYRKVRAQQMWLWNISFQNNKYYCAAVTLFSEDVPHDSGGRDNYIWTSYFWTVDGSVSLQIIHTVTALRCVTASFWHACHFNFFLNLSLLHTKSWWLVCVIIQNSSDLAVRLHLLDDAFLGLQHEVAVVHPGVGEVDTERGECPEGLGVFSL